MVIRIIESISSASGWLAQWASYVMMGLISIDVGLRYIFRKPFLWTDEISIYLMLYIAFIGAAATLKAGRHIQVDILWSRLPIKVRLWLDAITTFISLVVLCIVLYQTILWVYQSYVTKWTAPSILLTPFWIPQSVIPIGLFFLVMQCMVGLYKAITAVRNRDGSVKGGQLPK